MKTIRLVLADQLTRDLSALRDLDPARDVVLMVEAAEETAYVPHHPKKIAFLFAAMRHFARGLRDEGIAVDYVVLDDPDNTGSFRGEVGRALRRHAADRVVVTEPGEWRVLDDVRGWKAAFGVGLQVRLDDRFLCSIQEFRRWAEGRKAPRMEHFYREMRKRTGWLMTADGLPENGRWNYDKENRKPPKGRHLFARPAVFAPDATTEAVLDSVGRRFGNRFGDLRPFWFAVTREQALFALDAFIKGALRHFGDWQDAMVEGEDYLYHCALSQYVNAGLLTPREVCEAAVAAYAEGVIPINSAEGFLRQILGWREYVRGIYWLEMPNYVECNALNATRTIPAFYWNGETEMNCMRRVIDQTRREALSHHIQRLMITGNFALLAGIDPRQVHEWYLAVYADAYEWVELPNTLGMALYADGGLMGSKPYAGSGAYIDRMSTFCKNCRFDVKQKAGPDACPFNYLYWDFVLRHEEHFAPNPRMGPIVRNAARLDPERRAAIAADAKRFLDGLTPYAGEAHDV